MTKIEKKMRKRERDAINAVNKSAEDLKDIYDDALKVLFDLALVLVGIVLGMYLSATRTQAATVSIPPRCEYVGPITEAAPEVLPVGINEMPVATMPDAQMVERVGEEPERWESLGTWLLTAYCPLDCCNGRGRAWHTASGAPMVIGDTVAVGGLPFGTKLRIRDHIYTVTDRGVHGHHVDILHESHRAANKFGMQHAEVFIKR
ncbi:MAG: 3D domain-containing protein [Stomatobaculum sp.]|nr:3D domain-containing protein [Stomatobaculum sp.]